MIRSIEPLTEAPDTMLTRIEWERWLVSMKFRRCGNRLWTHVCAHCLVLIELDDDGPMLGVMDSRHASHPDYHAVKSVISTTPTREMIVQLLELAESQA